MKCLHRENFFSWSQFDEARDVDFHSTFWRGSQGSLLIDPLPLSEHDAAHLARLGGVDWIVVTNSDHVRESSRLATQLSARLAGPAAEQTDFPLRCDRYLADGDELAGAQVFALEGSKTPGELALLCELDTLVTGDLIRSHAGGRLDLLPQAEAQRSDACETVRCPVGESRGNHCRVGRRRVASFFVTAAPVSTSCSPRSEARPAPRRDPLGCRLVRRC